MGLNRRTYEQAGVGTEGNNPGSTKEPGIGWMTAFLFVTSFVGLLALVPIRKVFHFISELYDVSHDTGHSVQLIVQMLLFSMFCCLVIYSISDDFFFIVGGCDAKISILAMMILEFSVANWIS